MSELLRISGASFRERLIGRPLSDIDASQKPRLHWIAIASLRVDHRYQRKIAGRASEKNVLAIAEAFSWSKFAPVVVAESGEEGVFSIIDGQHRVTAAALRGIKDVPCLVHVADLAGQAEAFAAINGNVTAISTMQLFHAKVAAGDPASVELEEACREARVNICRYPVPAAMMKVGDTLAAGKLAQQLQRYGRPTLVAALSCITRTGDGNVGMVRAQVVEALCAVLNSEPDWYADLGVLLDCMQSFDFHNAFGEARVRASTEMAGIAAILIEIVCRHMEKAFAAKA